MSVEVDIAVIKEQITNLNKLFEEKLVKFDEHVDGSVAIRDEVNKNSNFRSSAIWMIRSAWLAIIGLFFKTHLWR